MMTSGNFDYSSGDTILRIDWNGEDDPIFKRRINTYSKSRIAQFNPPGVLYSRRDGSGSYQTVNGRWVYATSDDMRRLQFDMAGKLSDLVRRHDFNALVTAAEAGKTLSLLAGTVTGVNLILENILYQARVFKKASPDLKKQLSRRSRGGGTLTRDALAVQEYIQNLWLQARYGWRPLLGDAYNYGEAMATLLSSPSPWSVATVKRTVPIQFTITDYVNITDSGQTAEISHRMKFRLAGDPSVPEHLGLKDPASLLWEIIPYSFVVDWFAPVGTFISAYERLSGVNDAETIFTERTRVKWGGPNAGLERDGKYFGVLPYQEDTFSFSRSQRSLSSFVPTSVPLRSFGEVLRGTAGALRCLDALALLGGTTSRLLRL